MKKKDAIMPNLQFKKNPNTIDQEMVSIKISNNHSWKNLLKNLDHRI